MMKTWLGVLLAVLGLGIGFVAGGAAGGAAGLVGGALAGAPVGACLMLDELQKEGVIDRDKARAAFQPFVDRLRREIADRGLENVKFQADSCADVERGLDELRKKKSQ